MPTMNVSLPDDASDIVTLRRAVGIGIEQARTGQLSKRSVADIAAAVQSEALSHAPVAASAANKLAVKTP